MGKEWRDEVKRRTNALKAQRRMQKGRYRVKSKYANAQPGVLYTPDRLRGEDDRDDDDG